MARNVLMEMWIGNKLTPEEGTFRVGVYARARRKAPKYVRNHKDDVECEFSPLKIPRTPKKLHTTEHILPGRPTLA